MKDQSESPWALSEGDGLERYFKEYSPNSDLFEEALRNFGKILGPLIRRAGDLLENSGEFRSFILDQSELIKESGEDPELVTFLQKEHAMTCDAIEIEVISSKISETLAKCRNKDQAYKILFYAIGSAFSSKIFPSLLQSSQEAVEAAKEEIIEREFIVELLGNKDFKPEAFPPLLRKSLKALRENSGIHKELISLLQGRLDEINAERKLAAAPALFRHELELISEEEKSPESLMSSLEEALTQKGNSSLQRRELRELISLLSDVNISSASGHTPLYFAVSFGDSESVKELIGRGADVNARGILSAAVSLPGEGKSEIMTALLPRKLTQQAAEDGALTAISLGKTKFLSQILNTKNELVVTKESGFFNHLRGAVEVREKKCRTKEKAVRGVINDFEATLTKPKAKKQKASRAAPAAKNDFEQEGEEDPVLLIKEPRPAYSNESELKAWVDAGALTREEEEEQKSSRDFLEEFVERRRSEARKLVPEEKSELRATAKEFRPQSGLSVVSQNNQERGK